MKTKTPGKADYRHRDENGLNLDGPIAGRFAIVFWDDFVDRHLKIMFLTLET